MRGLQRLLDGLIALVRRHRLDRDLDDELQQFLEASIAGKIAGGMPLAEAKRAARLELGSPAAVKDWTRDAGWESHVESVWLDLRYAARTLCRSPGFALAAIGTLAVGLGATTGVYAVVDAVLVRPFPFNEPERVVQLRFQDDAGGIWGIGAAAIRSVRELPGVEFAAGTVSTERAIVSGDVALLAMGEAASAEFFQVFGVPAARGRTFTSGDRGGEPVVVLSDRLWRRAFGSRDAVIGTSIGLGGVPHRVLGVMPAEFRIGPGDRAEFWVLRPFPPSESDAYGSGPYYGIARLRETGLDVARAQVSSLALPAARSSQGDALTLAVVPMLDAVAEFYGRILWSLLGAVALVLLLACGNVANLLLARGRQRTPELQIRAAIGAGRGRLLRQLLTECVVIATVAAAAGTGIAWLLVRLLPLLPLTSVSVSRIDEVALNGRIALFLVVLTFATVLVFGLLPAWMAARRSLVTGAARAMSTRHGRLPQALIACEIAATLALLSGTGLVALRLADLVTVDVGFELNGLRMASLRPIGERYDAAELTRVYNAVRERARERFGLDVALMDRVPLDFWFASRARIAPAGSDATPQVVGLRVMSHDALDVLGATMLAGRRFSPADRPAAPAVALVNATAAARLTGLGLEPLGAMLTIARDETRDTPEVRVVGIVDDLRDSVYRSARPEIYLSATQFPPSRASFILRNGQPIEQIEQALRQALRDVDAQQALSDVAAVEDRVRTYTALSRFVGILLALFAALAVLLATTGILAVAAGAVAVRTREIGIRVAVGATRWHVLAALGRDVLPGVLVGAAIGALAAASLGSVLQWMTPGVASFHPVAFGGAVVVIAAVAACGGWLPARRALAIAPTIALTTPEEW